MKDDAYQDSDLFTDAEKAAIAWAYHLTKYTFAQNPEALENMKKHYDHAQVVEATLVSGYFNMWNRFTDALEIDIEGDDQMILFTKSATIDKDIFAEFMNECWWAGEGGRIRRGERSTSGFRRTGRLKKPSSGASLLPPLSGLLKKLLFRG